MRKDFKFLLFPGIKLCFEKKGFSKMYQLSCLAHTTIVISIVQYLIHIILYEMSKAVDVYVSQLCIKKMLCAIRHCNTLNSQY